MVHRTGQVWAVGAASWALCVALAGPEAHAQFRGSPECDADCQRWAERLYDECVLADADPVECDRRSALLLEECQRDVCGWELPGPTCEEFCSAAVENETLSCVSTNVLYELCLTLAQSGYDQCIEEQCQFQLAEPPCPVQCRGDAETLLVDCVDDGNMWQDCAVQSLEYAETCIAVHCEARPICDGACESVVHGDARRDAVFRRTDRGRDGNFDPQGRGPIDLLDIRVGAWTPDDAYVDPFAGRYHTAGAFVRIDLTLDGLVNPPGALGPISYTPYQHGPKPLYGFIEFDMDNDADTGGEIDRPLLRYLGNVARFGGVPTAPRFFGRVAVDSTAFLRSFVDPPFIERSGEEFHLAFLGNEAESIDRLVGDSDQNFEPGEAWLMWGRFFHRAHGYEEFSFVFGGDHAGEYAPLHPLLFWHDPETDQTQVTVVFPLTQAGAAALYGDEYVEDVNSDASDQASVTEALSDLRLSAEYARKFPSGFPEEALIRDWADKDPAAGLDPRAWRVMALVGTAYGTVAAGPAYFVWTDVFPNPVVGDINGNGIRGEHDACLIADFIAANDLNDGVSDESAPVPLDASYFSVMDLDYSGTVDHRDVPITNGDTDQDGDSDLRDYATFQRCFGNTTFATPCFASDFNRNEILDVHDATRLRWWMVGPR